MLWFYTVNYLNNRTQWHRTVFWLSIKLINLTFTKDVVFTKERRNRTTWKKCLLMLLRNYVSEKPIVLFKFYMSLYFQCLVYFLLFEVKKVKNKNEEDERLVKYPNLAFRFVDATTKIIWAKSLHCKSRSKKGVLKILTNSQENTCVGVSFLIKLQAGGLRSFIKKENPTRVFRWILGDF